jgi:hypothetical protein
MNTLEFYQQTYTYDTGNNLTNLSHQANSSTWQQTLTIHPNNNRGNKTAFYPVPQKTLGILQKINPVFAKTKK